MPLIPGQTTIGTIRTTAKDESQMRNNPVCSDAEWNGYIQQGASTLIYGKLVDKFGQNYSQKIYIFNADGQTSLYDLPPDTYKLTKVDFQVLGMPSAFWDAAQRVEISVIQRYDLPAGYASWTNQVYYALMGEWGKSQKLWLAPLQPNGRPIRLIYVPRYAVPNDRGQVRLSGVMDGDAFTFTATGFGSLTLTAGADFDVGDTDLQTAKNLAIEFNAEAAGSLGDAFTASAQGKVVTVQMTEAASAEIAPVVWSQTGGHMTLTPPTGWTNLVDGVNGWEEILVVDAAIKALDKQYRDTSAFQRRMMKLDAMIEDQAANRDAGAPVTGADVLGLDDDGAWAQGMGRFGGPAF